VSECGARWIESAEVFCALEQGHAFEHRSKMRIEYENGVVGSAEIIWCQESQISKGEN